MAHKPLLSSRRFHPNVWVLTVTSFLTDISSEMLVNLLPLFLFNVLGLRTPVVGAIEGLAETTSSLFKVYSGGLSDQLGRRKPLTVLGYSLSTLTKPFLYFATTWSWVLGVRIIDRAGKGIRTAPRDALLASSVEPDRRGLAFGLHRMGDTAGAFTGLAIAALIIRATQSGAGELTRFTFQQVVLASTIPAALAVLVLVLGLRELPMHQGEPAVRGVTLAGPRAAGGLSPQLHWKGLSRRFKAFLVVMVIFTLGNSSDAFIILRGQERGLNVLEVMGMLLTFNAVYSLLSGPAGSLSDRLGRKKLLLAGWLVYGLVYLGFAASRTGSQVWILFALYGVYYAMTEGVAKAFIADLIPAHQRGTAYGLYHGVIGMAAFPASLAAGFLWQGMGGWGGFGPAAPFYFGAGMALFASVLLAMVGRYSW